MIATREIVSIKNRILISLLLCIFSILNINAESVKIGELYYNLDVLERTASVTQENGTVNNYKNLEDVVIPEEVIYNDYLFNVTAIAPKAFERTSIKSVKIASSIRTIGSRAFYNCRNLNRIEFNDGLEFIEDEAFAYLWELTSVDIPGTCKKIGNMSFEGCSKLSDIILREGIEKIGSSAFLGDITSEIVIPSSVKTIGGGAFSVKDSGTIIFADSNFPLEIYSYLFA